MSSLRVFLRENSVFSVVSAFVLFLPSLAICQDPAQTRGEFLRMLDRPKVAADVKETSAPSTADGLVTERFTFASEKKADGTVERVPVLLVRPEKPGKYPAIICLHGTGGNKEALNGWLIEFARQGVIGVAIDARYHGQRVDGVKGSVAYVAAIAKAWKEEDPKRMEHPFYYDTVWDLWRLVDVLEARPDVDGKHIGMLGISMGGIQTWLAASVDERIAVAAPLIAVQSFKWSLENERWQGRANTIRAAHDLAAKDIGEPMVNRKVCERLWNKVIPGMLDKFDCPTMLTLFAPRPLFIANGDKDNNCPVEGARIAIKAAEDAYDRANAKDRLKSMVGEGVGHTVTNEARKEAVEFCVKWLKAK